MELKKLIETTINEYLNEYLNEEIDVSNSLPYEEFDNIENSKWRKMEHNGNYNGAIKYMMNYYINNKENLLNYQIGAIFWHIGQIYATDNNYKNAIEWMSKPEVSDSIEPNYQKGTISFLKNDLKKLQFFYNKLIKNDPTDGSGRDILKKLINNFGLPYKEVY
jgi:hypothetical protein